MHIYRPRNLTKRKRDGSINGKFKGHESLTVDQPITTVPEIKGRELSSVARYKVLNAEK